MDQLTIPTFAELKRSSEDYSVSKRESFPSHGGAVASKRSPRLPSLSLLQWSSGRRYCSEPGALVDSGRSSLTSLGSQESLAEDYPEELDVFSDSYCSSDEESDIEDECYNSESIISQYRQKWSEWVVSSSSINFNDTTVNTPLRETIRKGYWHGTIWLHQRSANNQQDIHSFVQEVNTLCKIRHENIQLFMGICLDLPDETFGIIMSEVKGETLYSHTHKQSHNFTTPSKLKILRQITEGMEYLHAKGINHGNLTSKLITIHHRVCISLSFPSTTNRILEGYELAYLPPEDIQQVQQLKSGKKFHLSTKPNQSSDIYAFGTITYELMTLKLPFHNETLLDLVWSVGNYQYQSVSLIPQSKFRSIIKRCWTITRRTTFKDILTSIQDNLSLPVKLRSSYSTSTPVELYTTGK